MLHDTSKLVYEWRWFNDITITYINVDMVTSYCVYTIINNNKINRLVEVMYNNNNDL